MQDGEVAEGSWSFFNDWPLRRFSILTISTLVLLLSFCAFRTVQGDYVMTAICGLMLTPLIILVPGASLLRIGKYHSSGFLRSLFYSFTLGIGSLMALGFVLNLFHFVGIVEDPLRMIPIFAAYTLMTISFLTLAIRRDNQFIASAVTRKFDTKQIITWIFSIMLPFGVTVAAALVNSVGDYTLMFWLIFLICAIPLAVYGGKRSYAPLVLSVSIALLLHRTLITNYIIGYDVFSEYSAAYITTMNGWWNISQSLGIYGGSANTALSIVTLAPVLTYLTSIETVEMLKIVYPLLFAIVPLGLYKLIKSQFGPQAGFLGVMTFVGYQAFFGLMMQLGKQEISEIFLVGFLLVLTDSSLSRMKKYALLLPFTIGVVVSHYGIGILVIILFVIVFGLQVISHIVGSWMHRQDDWQGPIHWLMRTIKTWLYGQLRTRVVSVAFVAFSLVAFLVWYAFVGSGMILPYVGLNEVTSSTSVLTEPTQLTIRNFEALEYLFIDFGSDANNLEKYIVLFTQIITGVGVLWVFASRKCYERIDNDYAFLAAAAGIFLVMSYFLPNLAGNFYYGRIFTFTSIFLSGFFVVGMHAMLKPFRIILNMRRPELRLPSFKTDRIAIAASCIMVIALLATNTGLMFDISDDFVGSVALEESTSWAMYTDSDVVTAKWLSDREHIGQNVPVADWHRFTIFGGLATPIEHLRYQFTNESTDSFVYLSEWNNKYGYVYPLNTTGGSTMTYCTLDDVTRQVGGQYDTIYSTSEFSTVIYIPPVEIDQNPPGPYIYTYEDTPIYVFGTFFGAMLVISTLAMLVYYAKVRTKKDGQ